MKVKQLVRGVAVSLLTMSIALAQDIKVQEAPTGALVPPGSGLRITNGTVSTSEYLDYVIKDMKARLRGDKDVMDCFALTPKNIDKVYDAASKYCKTDQMKVTPPRIRPPMELDRVAGRFGSCMQGTMLKKQNRTQRQFYECGQEKKNQKKTG
jgi:hypothetical protein